VDLKQEIARLVAAGQSDAQVRAFMVERYGDYVLYDPPVAWHTAALWSAPLLLLVAALAWAWRSICRQPPASPEPPG
jgi:cytochrome c-type biogenesis protein CcmH